MSIENEFYSGASTRTQLTLLAIEYGNLSIPANLVMTSAYAQTSPARTDSGVKGKKTEQCRERNPWYVRCVSFWRKTNHLKGNQPVKFLIQVSCVWVTTKFSVINFWGLVTFLVTDSRNNLVSPNPSPPAPPPWSLTYRVLVLPSQNERQLMSTFFLLFFKTDLFYLVFLSETGRKGVHRCCVSAGLR